MKLLHLIEMTVDQAVKIFVTHGEDVRGADAKRVKSARNALVRKFQNDLRTGGESDLKLINAAYDVLKNGVPVDRPYRSSRPDADADRSYYRSKPADEPSRQDYTDVRYLKQHIAELARASGGKVREWTIWGFDGHFFRGAVTVWGCPEVFKDMAEAMYKWQTGGGNPYPCRAVFVTKNDTPDKTWLIYADDQMYDLDSPVFEFDSPNMNPGNDQSFVRKLPELLDNLFDPEDDDEGPLKERAQPITDPAFRSWFGRSKVVNSDGSPMKVYHGTAQNIEHFSEVSEGVDGIFFSSSPGIAGEYADWRQGEGEGGSVYPVYLSMQNPLVVDYRAYLKKINDGQFADERDERGEFASEVVEDIVQTAKDFGRDGVIIHGIRDGWTDNSEMATTFIAFQPNQVKSVFNRGGWNPNAPGLSEAPIGDYALVGNWGDKEASNGFRHAQDRKIIQSENLIKKVRRKFGNTEHMLNFYFINLPGTSRFAETGVMTPEALAENMPQAWKLIQEREAAQGTDASQSINVLYVGNAGTGRVPMTAWIMGHRLGHAVNAARGAKKSNSWNDLEREFSQQLITMFREVYSWKVSLTSGYGYGQGMQLPLWSDPDVAKFLEEIGTMASARNGKLGGRPYEFMYEMFSQYITTGKLEFRELPKRFGRSKSVRYVRDEEMREMYSRDLNLWFADHLTSYMDNVMYEATGKYLVM